MDISLKRPGYPAGKVMEFFGYERTGKTAAVFKAIAHAQRRGGAGYFIDTEFAWDEPRAIDSVDS